MPAEVYFRDLPEHPPLWRQLARELREWVHPPPDPDLHLESAPIRVKDIWTHRSSAGQRAGSVAIHAAVIGLLMLPLWRPVRQAIQEQTVNLTLPVMTAPGRSLPRMKRLAGGGTPLHPVAPRRIQPVVVPMAVIPPVPLMPATAVPNLNLPQVGNIGAIAGPPGVGAGLSGAGPGGAGDSADGGGDCVEAPCGAGGDISEPVPVYDPDPEYSDAARKAKFQGTVIVGVIIGVDGHVYDPKIVQSVGLGLDQKALDAVRTWRFEPAKRAGQPIRVEADIEVNFHLY